MPADVAAVESETALWASADDQPPGREGTSLDDRAIVHDD
jgi:hypothetical protein